MHSLLITVDQFREMRDPPNRWLELRGGMPVPVEYPKMKHYLIRSKVAKLIEDAYGKVRFVGTAFPFRPEFEYELRVADACWISPERMRQAPADDDLFGSPELVIEVLYSSKTATDTIEKRDLCFTSGCEEFWLIDEALESVEVTRPGSSARWFTKGDSIPIGRSKCRVDDIFETTI